MITFGQKKAIWIIIFLLAIATAWRLYFALKLNYWFDELWAYYFANYPRYSFRNHIIAPLDDRPPIHYLLLKLMSGVSTHSLWLRLPSVLAGIALLIGIIRYAWKKSIAWAVVAAILGVNFYMFVRMSTQARDYGLMIYIAWLQVSMVLAWLDEKQAKSIFSWQFWCDVACWSLVSLLGLGLNYAYIPFFGSVVVSSVLVGIARCYRHRVQWKSLWLWAATVLLGSIPALLMIRYYLFVSNQMQYLIQTTNWINDPNVHDVIKLLITLFGLGVDANHDTNNFDLLVAQFGYLLFGLSVLSVGWLQAWKKPWLKSPLLFGTVTVFLNIAVVVIASMLSKDTSYFINRFFVPISVVCFLLLSISVWQLWELLVTHHLRWIFLLFFLLFTPLYLVQENARLRFFGDQEVFGRENELFVNRIKSLWKPGDQLIFLTLIRFQKL